MRTQQFAIIWAWQLGVTLLGTSIICTTSMKSGSFTYQNFPYEVHVFYSYDIRFLTIKEKLNIGDYKAMLSALTYNNWFNSLVIDFKIEKELFNFVAEVLQVKVYSFLIKMQNNT